MSCSLSIQNSRNPTIRLGKDNDFWQIQYWDGAESNNLKHCLEFQCKNPDSAAAHPNIIKAVMKLTPSGSLILGPSAEELDDTLYPKTFIYTKNKYNYAVHRIESGNNFVELKLYSNIDDTGNDNNSYITYNNQMQFWSKLNQA